MDRPRGHGQRSCPCPTSGPPPPTCRHPSRNSEVTEEGAMGAPPSASSQLPSRSGVHMVFPGSHLSPATPPPPSWGDYHPHPTPPPPGRWLSHPVRVPASWEARLGRGVQGVGRQRPTSVPLAWGGPGLDCADSPRVSRDFTDRVSGSVFPNSGTRALPPSSRAYRLAGSGRPA